MFKDNNQNMTNGRLLFKNTFFNLFGQIIPTVIAIFIIPFLIKGMGTDRFGILSLAWMILSYFSFFDFGVGRALTQLIAEKIGKNLKNELPLIIWTSLFIMLLMSIFGMASLGLISSWLVDSALKIPNELKKESLYTFYLLALSIPVVIITTGLAGVLQALQRFDLFNYIRIPMGLFTFIGPLIVLFFTNNLAIVVVVLLFGRIIAMIAHFYFCFKVLPDLISSISIDKKLIKSLLSFGGWMTLTNVFGPFLGYLDRFIIGSIISVASIAYYTIPYDLVSRLLIIPSAIVSVLFPAFSTSYAIDAKQTSKLFIGSIKFIFICMFPIIIILITFSYESINLWIGQEFAHNSFFIAQIIAICIFINSLAHVPFVLLQGLGKPDISAKLLLAQLPFYIPGLWWLVNEFGINGAAIAMLGRVIVDTILVFYFSKRLLPEISYSHITTIGVIAVTAILFLAAFLIASLFIKIIFISFVAIFFIFMVYFVVLKQEEKNYLFNLLKR